MGRRWIQKYLKFALLMLFAVAIAASCGPSIRRTHQSDNAFQRCFDMDHRPGAADTEKEACWKGWLSKHVYNQPGDKIRYADLRLDELAKGLSIPGPPGPPGQFDQRPSSSPDAGAGQTAPAPLAAGQVLVTSDDTAKCTNDCVSAFQICQASCLTDAGTDERCGSACKTSRSACLALCSVSRNGEGKN